MTRHHDDFAFEPVRGLPAVLPPGERMLWQGAPRWQDAEKQPLVAEHPMLHAWKLALDHPTDGRRISVAAPLPERYLKDCGEGSSRGPAMLAHNYTERERDG